MLTTLIIGQLTVWHLTYPGNWASIWSAKCVFFGPKKMRFMQTESVLQTKNQSGPAKNRFSVALPLTTWVLCQTMTMPGHPWQYEYYAKPWQCLVTPDNMSTMPNHDNAWSPLTAWVLCHTMTMPGHPWQHEYYAKPWQCLVTPDNMSTMPNHDNAWSPLTAWVLCHTMTVPAMKWAM